MCWQGADDGMFVLFMRLMTKVELEPLFVGCKDFIFFHVLLTTPAHVQKLSERDSRGCWRDGPIGRNPGEFLQKGTEPDRNEVTSLEVHDKWNQSHQSLSPPSHLFNHFSSESILRIYCGNPHQDNYMLLVKGKPKITLNLGKTFYKL